MAVEVLEASGYEVIGVESGEAGLEAAYAAPPDLVVMDIQLPGIDGLEVARRLQSDPTMAAIPLLAVTAEAMAGDEERIRAAGCSYLSKPLHFATFVSTVNQLISANGG